MARKPNYSFERNQRAKKKALKRQAKREAKLASKAQIDGETVDHVTEDSPASGSGKQGRAE